MTHHTPALKSALLSTLLLTACASVPTERRSSAPMDLTVVVRNQNTQDMKLYVVSGAQRVRVGTAHALGTTQLRLPGVYTKAAGGLKVYAEPIGGGRAFAFPEVVVDTSDRLVLDIQQTITMSTFAVYPTH